LTKSTFHHSGLQGELLKNFKEAYSYNFLDLAKGFKYLGYFLKDGKYKFEDWRSILAKFEK